MEELDDVAGECESDRVPVPKVMKEKVETLKQRLTGNSQALGRGKIPKEAQEYKMNHRRRGRAVVFNQMNFSSDPKRNGAETDSKNLTQAKPLKLLALQWRCMRTKKATRLN